MNAVAIQGAVERLPQSHPASALTETSAIVQMIERAASNPAVDIDKMERLLEMQERVLARNAREAFNAAFAVMQSELPTIAERGKGDKNMKYALWEDVNDGIKPVLARHGFGISFKTGRTADRVTVTAILMHRQGHSEETTLELPIDTSGSKNAVQAVGSSTSYGKRYTAQALLNLTSRDGLEKDDDGKAAGLGGRPTLSDDQVMNLRDLLAEIRMPEARLVNKIGVPSLADIYADKFAEVVAMLKAKRGQS